MTILTGNYHPTSDSQLLEVEILLLDILMKVEASGSQWQNGDRGHRWEDADDDDKTSRKDED